jgi:hypothetical protein
LSPAFTVAYVDNLEVYFQKIVRELLNKYQSKVVSRAASERGFETDFMEDLHNVALDM